MLLRLILLLYALRLFHCLILAPATVAKLVPSPMFSLEPLRTIRVSVFLNSLRSSALGHPSWVM